MLNKFDNYLPKRLYYKEHLKDLLFKEMDKIFEKNYDFKDSLFQLRGAQIKMLLQSDSDLFWAVWDYAKRFNDSTVHSDSVTVNKLKNHGIAVIENFLSTEQIEILQNAWNTALSSIPQMNETMEQNTLLHRFHFEKNEGIGYAIGSLYDGKKRVTYYDLKLLEAQCYELLVNNSFFNKTVAGYYGLERECLPNAVMMEHLFSPLIEREDTFWHIDNLTDQFKVMLVLEDMDENDGPFTFVEGTHRIVNNYKNRYHKMYTMNGMTTQEHNHFEEAFVEIDKKKKGILKSGSVVLFDCRIHHTATFPKNNGSRKNIMLYFATIPTARNKFFNKVDRFLNFGLR